MKAGTFKFIENWEIKRVNHFTGEVLDVEEKCNTIVDDGLERMADLIINESSVYYRALAIGTGITGATTSDTALETEYTRELATLSKDSVFVAKFFKTFEFGSGVSEDITEAGIFDSAVVSASTMLARTTFSAKSISLSVDLIITATITMARV